MPSIRSLFVFVSIVTTVACVPPPPLSPQAVALTPGFERAESAVYAATLGVWLVSNIGGNTPGDGFVSSVDATGRLLESRFVEGLDDPKGLALDGDTLYVADLTTLVRVQLDSPSTHEAIPIEGSVFLNDVAVDPASHAVYVSDTFGNAIYRVRGAESELLISDAALEAPNGLWVEQGGLLIGSIGPDLDTTTFQPRAPGRMRPGASSTSISAPAVSRSAPNASAASTASRASIRRAFWSPTPSWACTCGLQARRQSW